MKPRHASSANYWRRGLALIRAALAPFPPALVAVISAIESNVPDEFQTVH